MREEELKDYMIESGLVYHLDLVDEDIDDRYDAYLLVSKKDDTSGTKYFVGLRTGRMIDYSAVVAGPKGIELIDEDKGRESEIVAYMKAITPVEEFYNLLISGTEEYKMDYNV